VSRANGRGLGAGMDTALIVEDDRDQADLAAHLVRLRDYRPLVAGDGETGLRLAREAAPDVVLLDLMLPDTNGFEVCKRLRADRETMNTPVVMLTALGDAANRAKGFRVGANAYVAKPYDPAELFDAIAAARAWRAALDRGQVRGEILVELNSEARFLQEVNDFIVGLCRTTPLTAEHIGHVRQAVMEMGTNAIEWGNKHESDALVRITCRVHADRVEIVVRDEGAGFDRENLTHAASPDDPIAHMDVREKLGLREGGFGMLITKGMLDELRYNDPGNEVTLVKRFPPPEPVPEPER
jgi:DNA-binding response OmpR family regulator